MALGTSSAAPPRFYSIDEVADLLGVSPRTVRRWIKGGELRAHRFGRTGRTVRISRDDLLEDFVVSHAIRSGDRRPDLSRRVRTFRSVGKTPNK